MLNVICRLARRIVPGAPATSEDRPTRRHKAKTRAASHGPSVLDVVALLTDLPGEGLARGQVGTIVERLDDKTLLVEFSDDQGRPYAVAPRPQAELLVLHYVPEAA